MNPRCCQAVANRGSTSITAGSACNENTVATSVTSSSALCSRPSHSSAAKTVTSRAAPSRVAGGRTEISPSPPIRSRSASPRRAAGIQYSNSAATSRHQRTAPLRVGRSLSRHGSGGRGPGGCAVSAGSMGTAASSRTAGSSPGTASLPASKATSNGASTSVSDGPREDSEPGSRFSTGSPSSGGLRSAQVGRSRAGRSTGVPVGGVPGPGRTSGRRSWWSKSTWMPRARVSWSSAQPGRRVRPPAVTSRAPRSARSPSGAVPEGISAAGACRIVRYSLGAAIVTITASEEISATPAPVSPMRGSSSRVRPSTSAHNRPCIQASPAVRLCARRTAKYVSMTTRSTAPTANQRSSGVAASA